MAERAKTSNKSLDLRLQALAWLLDQKKISWRKLGRDLPSVKETTPQSWVNKNEWPEWAEAEICDYFKIGPRFFKLVLERKQFEEARAEADPFLPSDERILVRETLDEAISKQLVIEEAQKEAWEEAKKNRLRMEQLRDRLREDNPELKEK